ncbi:MAG: cupredoxin domain-containing protein [Chthoniobacterales bacterium]
MFARTTPKKSFLFLGLLVCLLFASSGVLAATFEVSVAPGGDFTFSPATVSIHPGDTVLWTWEDAGHSVTSGTPGQTTGLFDSGVQNTNFTFSFTFTSVGTTSYYCKPHGICCGMVGSVTVAEGTPTPSPSPSPSPSPASHAQLLNVSTRLRVQTGDNVLIGGFIVAGNDPKKVILRAIGPSLTPLGVTGALADPVLELHGSGGALITSNDNWKDTQQTDIEASGFAPKSELESAIIATLDPGAYTAIVGGKAGRSGVGLVEGYDLDQAADSQLGNISTRGLVESGDNVMIGGFILGNGDGTTNVLVRAIGPSLTQAGVRGAMADPTLELHDSNGGLLMSNDNWKETQEAEIEATGLAPANDLESAILVTLPTAAYTAIVAGKNDLTGVALVEAYRLP